MWGNRYWGNRYWGGRYWGGKAATTAIIHPLARSIERGVFRLPQLHQRIYDFVCGDALAIERRVFRVPAGQYATKGWFTIKSLPRDTDEEAIVALTITAAEGATGYFRDTGQVSQCIWALFVLAPARTRLLTPEVVYAWDMQFLLNDGGLYTPFKGTIVGEQEITIATA
jgi:hypothetical protein